MYSLPNLEPVCSSMSDSKCCFLTCIQVSQEADKVVWYSHLFQNFPQFILIHTVKGFGIVNKAEVDVSLELTCFPDAPADVGNLISGSSAFLKPAWTFFGIALFLIGTKTDFSSPGATAEFSKFAGILSAALSWHHLLGLEIAQLKFLHLR